MKTHSGLSVPVPAPDAGPFSGGSMVFFALLLAGQCAFYFRHPGHFFQCDTIWGFDNRLHSFSEIVQSFAHLDPGGWYRPLTNRMLQSVFYPVFGLHPTYYHLLLIPVFFINSLGVYYLAWCLTGRRLAAGIAATFYSMHTVNAYVTYDVAFFVELFWATCYIGSAIAFIHYIRFRNRAAWWVSLLFFVLGLMSKEPEVTLPATLVVLFWFESGRSGETAGERLKGIVSATAGHFVILALYLMFAVGYLHVGGAAVNSLFSKPTSTDAGQYHMVLGQTVFDNIDLAVSWAFNMPRGWHAQSRDLSHWMVNYLVAFRALTLVLVVALLFSPQRRIVFIGAAWFVIGVSPMLPLLGHFIPYYLYLPVVGVSMIVGAAFDIGYSAAARFPRVRMGALAVIFILLGIVCFRSIKNDIAHHLLMGGAADTALQSVTELRRLHPVLEPGTRLYFIDDAVENLSGYHLGGALFRVMYKDSSLQSAYSRLGDRLTLDQLQSGKVVALRVDDYGRFEDVTSRLIANPDWLVLFKQDPDHSLSVSPAPSHAGAGDYYVVKIAGLSDCTVGLFYALDGIEQPRIEVALDKTGEMRFPPGAMRAGDYHLVGFQVHGAENGIHADARLTVR